MTEFEAIGKIKDSITNLNLTAHVFVHSREPFKDNPLKYYANIGVQTTENNEALLTKLLMLRLSDNIAFTNSLVTIKDEGVIIDYLFFNVEITPCLT